MAYDTDVFISYAHEDNVPLIEGEKGWVTNFHRALKVRLGQLMKDPTIWRDRKLQGNDEFSKEIETKLQKSKVLVAVISPCYLKSQWCIKELRQFIKAAKNSCGINVGNKFRIFKIIKTYVPPEEQPAEIQKLLGYEFFHKVELGGNGHPYEFIIKKDSPDLFKFYKKLNDVAYEICDLIKDIGEPIESRDELLVPPPGKTVYLAETTSDLNEERENISRGLKQKGYTILPDKHLPDQSNDKKFKDSVRNYLKRCKLSIHLIGNQNIPILKGKDRSIIDLQNEVASEQCNNNQLTRLIWLPPVLSKNKKDDRQQKYITDFQRDVLQDKGTDLLNNITLEDFKTNIEEELEEINKLPKKKVTTTGPPRVYLVYNKSDHDSVESVSACFLKEKFKVLSSFSKGSGSAAQRRKQHEKYLSLCDAMMIYYNHGNKKWLDSIMKDMLKAPGLGRKKPLKSSIFITGEKTEEKENFYIPEEEIEVIKDYDPCFCEALKGVIDQIRR